VISRGHQSRDMDDRWDAYVEADRLFLHRSWTGLGIYEAQFAEADGGWRICEAVVAGDGTTYRREDAERESLRLLWTITGVLLGRWDDDLWQRIQPPPTFPCAFTVIDRKLLITDLSTGQTRWHGSPLGLPVEEVQPLTEGGGAVVLLDHRARTNPTDSNLVCVDCDGQLVWKLSLGSLSSPDAFVSLELVGDELVANSWAGRRTGIDPLTGDIRGWPSTR
jgi:hypothetical protein